MSLKSMFNVKRLRPVLACSALMFLPTYVLAQSDVNISTSPSSLCLTLENALSLAAEKSPGVLIAQGLEAQTAANLKEAKGLFLPRINAFNRVGVGDTNIVDSGVSNQVGLQASQRIIDFGDARLARQSADYFHKATQDETKAELLQAAFETGLTFLDALEAREQIDVTNRRQSYFSQHLSAIDKLLESGAATRTERASVAAQLAEANGFLLELQLAQARAATRIKISTESSLPLCTDSLDATLFLQTELAEFHDLEHVIDTALLNSPTIKALDNRSAALSRSKERQKRSRLPIIAITATGAYSSLGEFDNFEFQQRVGINVTLPLYAGNSISAANQRALGQENVTRGQALDARRELRQNISLLVHTIDSLAQQFIARQDVETNTRLQFEAAEIEQAAAKMTLRDLINIRLEYEQASLQTLQVKYQLARERLNLLHMTAKLPLNG